MGLLDAKLFVIFFGCFLIVAGIMGLFFLQYCEVNPEGLSEQVQGKMSEPLTLKVQAIFQDVIGGFADIFIAILCPLLAFIGGFLDYGWYILIGILLLVLIFTVPSPFDLLLLLLVVIFTVVMILSSFSIPSPWNIVVIVAAVMLILFFVGKKFFGVGDE